jgi:hypothetical protein
VKLTSINIKSTLIIKPLRLNRKNLVFCFLFIFLLICLFIIPADAMGQWKISPSNPTVGDTLTITGSGNKNIDAQISVVVEVPVSNGRYSLFLKNIKVPSEYIKNNHITARAERVQNLHVAVKKILTFNEYAKASGGVAIISASNIPPFTYDILIDGDAMNRSSFVNIKFIASGTLIALPTDIKGESKYNFDTSSLPAGKLTVNIGGLEQTMDLKHKEQNGPIQSTSKFNLITTRLKQIFSFFGKV